MKHRTIRRCLALLPVAGLLALASPGFAQEAEGARADREGTARKEVAREDPRLTRTKQRYAFATWPASERRWDGVPLRRLLFDGYRGRDVQLTPGMPVSRVFADADGVDRFLVELDVHETAAPARDRLVEILTFVSSPKKMPPLESAGVLVGDVGYVGPSREGRLSWIAFVRGNVTVRIGCLDPRADPHPDLRVLALLADRLIRDQAPLAAEASLTRPAFAALRPQVAACTAGDRIPFELEIDDALAFHWVVGGAGQGYVERDDAGRWVLHTTGAGSIELTCHVLGANGVAASRLARIEVGED